MRAAKYVRVSTDKQSEKFGIPSQLHELEKTCYEKNWLPVFDGE
jgi:DNA invertase Pin-like site-specific DNA recombinase